MLVEAKLRSHLPRPHPLRPRQERAGRFARDVLPHRPDPQARCFRKGDPRRCFRRMGRETRERHPAERSPQPGKPPEPPRPSSGL